MDYSYIAGETRAYCFDNFKLGCMLFDSADFDDWFFSDIILGGYGTETEYYWRAVKKYKSLGGIPPTPDQMPYIPMYEFSSEELELCKSLDINSYSKYKKEVTDSESFFRAYFTYQYMNGLLHMSKFENGRLRILREGISSEGLKIITDENNIQRFLSHPLARFECKVSLGDLFYLKKFHETISRLHPESKGMNLAHLNQHAISVTSQLVDSKELSADQILEIRKDKESISKLRRFHLFFHSHSDYEGKDEYFIRDDLQNRIDEYRETMKFWGFDTTIGAFMTCFREDKLSSLAASGLGAILGLNFRHPISSALVAGAGLQIASLAIEIRKTKNSALSRQKDLGVGYLVDLQDHIEKAGE